MVDKKKYTKLVDPDLWTAQEHSWIGSTPDYTPGEGEEWKWYVPQGVLLKRISIGQAKKDRQEKYLESGYLSSVIGIIDKSVRLSVSDINIETGRAKHSPRILGLSDGKNVIKFKGLAEKIYKGCAKEGIDLHRRLPGDTGIERKETGKIDLVQAFKYLTG